MAEHTCQGLIAVPWRTCEIVYSTNNPGYCYAGGFFNCFFVFTNHFRRSFSFSCIYKDNSQRFKPSFVQGFYCEKRVANCA